MQEDEEEERIMRNNEIISSDHYSDTYIYRESEFKMTNVAV
jgi:hypothetical protein